MISHVRPRTDHTHVQTQTRLMIVMLLQDERRRQHSSLVTCLCAFLVVHDCHSVKECKNVRIHMTTE